MTILKAVIGANYGDEGKGFMTDYLCRKAKESHQSCLVICTNGGAQRGHTVETTDGKRFVFHHLGSGTLADTGTYFCEDYILNPVLFRNDWNAYLNLCDQHDDLTIPNLAADPKCRFSTPYDMITNQIFEDARGSNRHGSVGAGIWETVRRYQKGFGIPVEKMIALTDQEQFNHLLTVREYFRKRIQKKIGKFPEELTAWKEIWESEEFIWNYLNDFRKMTDLIVFHPVQELAKYDILIAENAQGVLLTQNRYDGTDYTTPSDTGALEIYNLLNRGLAAFVTDTELHYVTRSYLTKHGAGTFAEECPKEELSPCIERDLTNVPNDYQGTLRYGKLDPATLLRHIEEDCADMQEQPFHVALTITHTNEVPAAPIIDAIRNNIFAEKYQLRVYESDAKTYDSVKPVDYR